MITWIIEMQNQHMVLGKRRLKQDMRARGEDDNGLELPSDEEQQQPSESLQDGQGGGESNGSGPSMDRMKKGSH